MATPAQRTNTWTLDEWYDQAVAGTTGGYQVAKELWIWGDNDKGQLGQNDKTDRSSPTQVGTNTTWNVLGSTTSSYQSCFGIKSDGTMWGWGSNSSYGLVGNSSSTPVSSPIQIGTETTWKAVFGGNNTMLASKTDGTLWNWGNNPEGGLGQNNRTGYSSPKQVGGGTDWSGTNAMIGVGEGHQGAIKTDGTLWTWGQNYKGELGLNEAPKHTSSPAQVGSDTNWRDIKFSARGGFGSKTDGTLWSWGYNHYGALGHNNRTQYSSPTQIGTGTDWSGVSDLGYSGYSAWAIKTDGTLWAMGNNEYGVLGQNNSLVKLSSPTQIPGTTWVNFASAMVAGAGQPILFASKSDGTLWSWGVNQGDWRGGLGQNDTINRSSPTQIGTDTDWFTAQGQFTAGGGWGAALKAS